MSETDWIELKPGVAWISATELNRIARQQGLCLAMAQASVYDEICQVINLPEEIEQGLVKTYETGQGINTSEQRQQFLQQRGWSAEDLRYFATKGERVERFRRQVFSDEVELRFLANKLDRDQIHYSLIRVRNGDLAFELHQRLQEGEASFEELAACYSEGDERHNGGRVGPVPLSQAHAQVAEKLRISQPGQLLPPFFLVDIWLILRLDSWQGARLDDDTRSELLQELFNDWLHQRVMRLLDGEQPDPLPLHLLSRELSGDLA
jgi:parvulin-like peptidyl-prolyl isomerase